MTEIRWGIIGCGDVTELKSGPAFNKVPNSTLVAVMRRDAAKAEDYARRHNVPKWHSNAELILNDKDVNAVYIATPPSSHEEYTLRALAAGKYVYVEKPMSMDYLSAKKMADATQQMNGKLCVAHYRRRQPLFLKVRELISSGAIGKPLIAQLKYFHTALSKEELQKTGIAWRVDPAISGGGLFHDLAPHQVDLALYFFGDIEHLNGLAFNQGDHYLADDTIAGNIRFKNGVLFSGTWSFNFSSKNECDVFEIYGTDGKVTFSVFGEPAIIMENSDGITTLSFDKPVHVQQYMVEAVVNYFLGIGENPCSGHEAVKIMKVIDSYTGMRCEG